MNNCFEFWHSAVTWSFGEIQWCDLMTFLIWERGCSWGCCDGAGWCFLGISSFDYVHNDFPTAAWSPNILANSCIAPKSGRGYPPIFWQRSMAFLVTQVWETECSSSHGAQPSPLPRDWPPWSTFWLAGLVWERGTWTGLMDHCRWWLQPWN